MHHIKSILFGIFLIIGLLALASCSDDDDKRPTSGNKGLFAEVATYSVGLHPWALDGADFDGDGDIDLVSADSYSNSIS